MKDSENKSLDGIKRATHSDSISHLDSAELAESNALGADIEASLSALDDEDLNNLDDLDGLDDLDKNSTNTPPIRLDNIHAR